MRIHYSENNSGGAWWLTHADYLALEAAGWTIDWVTLDEYESASTRLAWSALSPIVGSREEAIASWSRITGQDPYAPGCDCCGRPHSFIPHYEEND